MIVEYHCGLVLSAGLHVASFDGLFQQHVGVFGHGIKTRESISYRDPTFQRVVEIASEMNAINDCSLLMNNSVLPCRYITVFDHRQSKEWTGNAS